MAESEFKGGHEEQHSDGIVEDRKQTPPIYFNILFYGLILWAVVFCGYYLFSGWSSAQEFKEKMSAHTAAYEKSAPASAAPQATSQQETKVAAAGQAAGAIDAKALFAARCAGCHGADGKGGYGPDLSGAYEFGKTPEAITTSITKGREGKMPAFGGQLSSAEIEALAGYLLKL